MGLDLNPAALRQNYEIYEWRHACAILATGFSVEWHDIIELLQTFKFRRSWIAAGGGSNSPVTAAIDRFLVERGSHEKQFATSIKVDEATVESPTHKVDCFKNRVGLEVEWNNKDPFFDRDLNNFRLLFELRVISVGVIITRCDHLQDVFVSLGRGSTYGASTTHMSKLLRRIAGGGGAGCPILAIGISHRLYDETC